VRDGNEKLEATRDASGGTIYASEKHMFEIDSKALARTTTSRTGAPLVCRSAIAALALGAVTACVTVDHNTAASLGTAGMQATQALSAQASGAAQTLGDLSQWWGVRDTLVCVRVHKSDATKAPTADPRETCIKNAKSPQPDPSVEKLITVLNKGKQATDTLNQAYAAFVDLAHYNAGQQVTAALNTSFTDINAFLKAASALPGAAALAPISSTVEKAAAGVVGFIADNKQNAQILAANKDLQSANDALYSGLGAESKAMTSILVTLQQERQALYQSGFDAGLIDPTDILTPVFGEAYPGLRLQKAAPENQDVVKAAAQNVITLQDKQIDAAISSSYATSLSTLHALSVQHQKLANNESLNIDQIQTEVSNLKADISQINSSTTTSIKK
jgi:hypothetical protein